MSALNEHRLIARYLAPLATSPFALSLRDDAAFLSPAPGEDLVLTKDGIAEGFHFLPGERASIVARKALRVNLSDLAGKGAEPLGYLMLLGLSAEWTEDWLADFVTGLAEDQAAYGITLLGGDTMRAPGLVLSITAIGSLPQGSMVRRNGARPGDRLFVSGTIGDGALGLLAVKGEGAPAGLPPPLRASLEDRYRLPRPRCDLAGAVRRHAHAALDVSDGLAGDLDKMCAASGVTARVEIDRVPLSAAARASLAAAPDLVATCLTGGDDYEILCAVPECAAAAFMAAAAQAGTPVTEIGVIVEGQGPAHFIDGAGAERLFGHRAFSHTG